MHIVCSEMPPKRAASARVKRVTENSTSAADKSFCRRIAHSPPPKPSVVDEGTKEYYLIQIRDLENRVTR